MLETGLRVTTDDSKQGSKITTGVNNTLQPCPYVMLGQHGP